MAHTCVCVIGVIMKENRYISLHLSRQFHTHTYESSTSSLHFSALHYSDEAAMAHMEVKALAEAKMRAAAAAAESLTPVGGLGVTS